MRDRIEADVSELAADLFNQQENVVGARFAYCTRCAAAVSATLARRFKGRLYVRCAPCAKRERMCDAEGCGNAVPRGRRTAARNKGVNAYCDEHRQGRGVSIPVEYHCACGAPVSAKTERRANREHRPPRCRKCQGANRRTSMTFLCAICRTPISNQRTARNNLLRGCKSSCGSKLCRTALRSESARETAKHRRKPRPRPCRETGRCGCGRRVSATADLAARKANRSPSCASCYKLRQHAEKKERAARVETHPCVICGQPSTPISHKNWRLGITKWARCAAHKGRRP